MVVGGTAVDGWVEVTGLVVVVKGSVDSVDKLGVVVLTGTTLVVGVVELGAPVTDVEVGGVVVETWVVVTGRVVVGVVGVVALPPPHDDISATASITASKIPVILLFIVFLQIRIAFYTAAGISATFSFLKMNLFSKKNKTAITVNVTPAPTTQNHMLAGYNPIMVSVPNHFSR